MGDCPRSVWSSDIIQHTARKEDAANVYGYTGTLRANSYGPHRLARISLTPPRQCGHFTHRASTQDGGVIVPYAVLMKCLIRCSPPKGQVSLTPPHQCGHFTQHNSTQTGGVTPGTIDSPTPVWSTGLTRRHSNWGSHRTYGLFCLKNTQIGGVFVPDA